MARYKDNKEKCLDVENCGICIPTCPGATKMGEDGKAEVIDNEKLEECGGESVCPMGAIEKVKKEEEEKEEEREVEELEEKNEGEEVKLS